MCVLKLSKDNQNQRMKGTSLVITNETTVSWKQCVANVVSIPSNVLPYTQHSYHDTWWHLNISSLISSQSITFLQRYPFVWFRLHSSQLWGEFQYQFNSFFLFVLCGNKFCGAFIFECCYWYFAFFCFCSADFSERGIKNLTFFKVLKDVGSSDADCYRGFRGFDRGSSSVIPSRFLMEILVQVILVSSLMLISRFDIGYCDFRDFGFDDGFTADCAIFGKGFVLVITSLFLWFW